MPQKKVKNIFFFVFFFCSVLLVSVILVKDIGTIIVKFQKREIAVGMNNGSQIVDAIDEYYSDQNQYPKSLDVLIPKYLPKIPQTFFYQKFNYSFNTYDEYSVTFPIISKKGRYMCGYFKKLGEWECSGIGK